MITFKNGKPVLTMSKKTINVLEKHITHFDNIPSITNHRKVRTIVKHKYSHAMYCGKRYKIHLVRNMKSSDFLPNVFLELDI